MDPTIKNTLRTQQIIYGAQATVLFVFGAVVYYLITSGTLGKADYSMALTFQTIILVLVPASIAAGYFLFKSMVARVDKKLSLHEKLKKHFSLVIVRNALLEVPGLFCCVAAFLTVDTLFLAGVPVILFVFLLLRPTTHSMALDLNLNPSEARQLEETTTKG
jgi:hypothetical protein